MEAITWLLMDNDVTSEQVGEAAIRLFVILFGGKKSDSLNSLRQAKYMEMVASAKKFDPHRLSPTARAAHYHSFVSSLNPLSWGWKLNGSTLQPVITDLELAPQSLLKFIHCKCKLSTANPCGGNLCSCRKHGLKCVTACGDCRGESCRNAEETAYNDNNDIDSNAIDMEL